MSRTTLLPQHVADHLRSVRPMIYALYVLIIFDLHNPGRPAKLGELAAITGVDARTLEKQLNALCASDRATCTHQGYLLTELGRTLLLATTDIEAQDLALQDQDQAQQALESGPGAASIPGQAAKNAAFDGQRAAHNVCALEGGGESLDSKIKDSPPQYAQNVQLTTEKILAATPIIFGEPGVVRGRLVLDGIDPWDALACVAHAYDQRRHSGNPRGLVAPAGLVYRMLEDCKDARQQYRDDPIKYLPAEYLQVLGLETPAEDAEEAVETELAGTDQDPQLPGLPAINDSVEQPIPGTSITPVRAWEMVLGQLSMEMPRAGFDTWVRNTWAVSFVDDVLTVAAHNTYACDWLADRLTRTVERLLIGILNVEVRVVFTVSQKV